MLRSTLNSPGNPWSQSRRMIERVFPEIWTRADRQTDRRGHHNTLLCYRGRSNKK